MFLDNDGRAYLTRLGFEKGTTLIADRVEGDERAWVIRQGRVVLGLEASILANCTRNCDPREFLDERVEWRTVGFSCCLT